MERSIKLTNLLKTGDAYVVNFPNVGQLMEIDSMKIAISNNQYAEMVRSNLVSMENTLNLIDTVSTFATLIPELKSQPEFNKKSYLELDPFLAARLVKVYSEQFYPWYSVILKEFYDLMSGSPKIEIPNNVE